jgi:hypothetical protein
MVRVKTRAPLAGFDRFASKEDSRDNHGMRPLSLGFISAVAICASALAQGELRVYSASLVAAETTEGRVAVLPDAFVFIDNDRPESSFFAMRSNIQSLSAEGETITIQLDREVRDRAGSTTRVILRLAAATDAADVQRWFSSQTSSNQAGGGGGGGVLTFSAQRKKRLRGNTDGKLIVDDQRLIFESTDNASDSRRWDLKEIKELRHKNAYELEIRPFRGNKYVLMLSGTGMDNSQFREIVNRVTKSRTAR